MKVKILCVLQLLLHLSLPFPLSGTVYTLLYPQ